MTHLATRGDVFLAGKLDFMKPRIYFRTIKNPGVNPPWPQRIITCLLCCRELWQRLHVHLCIRYRKRVQLRFGCGVVLLTGLWFTRLKRTKATRGQASSIVGLLLRSRPQGNTAEQTEHTDIRDTELPARPTAFSFITAATDATIPLHLHPHPTPEISISKPSSTSLASQSRHPNSALQRQTNATIWSKSRKDHRRIFSHNLMVFGIFFFN